MPRGTRALYEIGGPTRFDHGVLVDEVVSAEYDYLPAACWCDTTFVVVTQREVTRGLTHSCGAEMCRPKDWQDGDVVVVGPVVPPSSVIVAGWNVSKAREKFGEHLEGRPQIIHARSRVEKAAAIRRRRATSPSIVRRRVRVRALHAAGHSARAIATRLMVPLHTVYNDLIATDPQRYDT